MRWFGQKAGPRGPRIFFATDIHGSEDCFRKFLNAGPIYDVEFLVLGGDILGKLLIPIVSSGNGSYECTYGDETFVDLDRTGLSELKRTIRRFGHYPIVGTAEELVRLEDPDQRDAAFRRAAVESLEEWVGLTDERLRGSGIRCFVAPGNDDFLDIDATLQESEVMEFAEDACFDLDDVHQVITTGYSNPTPWQTERELPEPDLRAKLDTMAEKARSPENLVAVIHAPPYNSGLDTAPALDEEFGMKVGAAGVEMAPVGSTAVREFIEEVQPLLGLHGHVHESGGATDIGRTLCLNPGSAYTTGVLMGAIVELGDGVVNTHQFVNG